MKPNDKYIQHILGLGLLVSASVFMLHGCSKGFLNVAVQGQQPVTQLWQTETDATNAVNAIYANLRTYDNTAFPPSYRESWIGRCRKGECAYGRHFYEWV